MVEDQGMSVQDAAAIAQDCPRTRPQGARHQRACGVCGVGPRRLIGYGAMWLSVRGQHPYLAPAGVSIAVVFVLAAFAAAAVLVVAHRAAAGIGGQSARNRRIVLVTWVTGYLILIVGQAAISGHVSTRALAFVGLAGPLLLAGLVYILAAILGRNRLAFAPEPGW